MKIWIILGVVAALAVGIISVQAGDLRAARDEVARLELVAKAQTERADHAEAALQRAESMAATQAQEQAIVCQGEGADLFNAGKRTGIAIGLSRCPVS